LTKWWAKSKPSPVSEGFGCAPGSKLNKRKLAELLAAMYPALVYDFQREAENRNPYRVRMFEAVALAAVCWQEIENK
jgi:hypothetical protein